MNRKTIAAIATGALALVVAAGLAMTRGHKDGHEDGHAEEGEHAHGETEKDGHAESEGMIELGDDQIEAAGIEIAVAKAGSIRKEIAFPAEIKLNADNVAHIFPRFAGVVRQVRKAVGDRVKKGEVLAVIESNESLNNYEIRSLIDGTIIERHVALGEMIRDDAECFVVADLSTVWVDINVYPKDLPVVREGNLVRVNASNIEAEAEGTIAYVGPVVSEHTRTALARVILPNPDNAWRPGIFVTAHVSSAAVEVPLVVSRDAIQTIEGSASVFIETDSGAFRAQAVTLGRKSDREIEIISGLKDGDRYVTKGTFVLKAELGKSEAGHSHD